MNLYAVTFATIVHFSDTVSVELLTIELQSRISDLEYQNEQLKSKQKQMRNIPGRQNLELDTGDGHVDHRKDSV